ncbi:MAG: NIF family HAD-type phosphatase [Gemmataceae bacterium]
MTVQVLALDLERTLVSEARTARPRPGLWKFLTFCLERFERVVIFTTVEEADAREVMDKLARTGYAPTALVNRLEYIDWSGEHKDLRFIPDAQPNQILFVDDDPGWIATHQKDRWIPIEPWDGGPDSELDRVRQILAREQS